MFYRCMKPHQINHAVFESIGFTQKRCCQSRCSFRISTSCRRKNLTNLRALWTSPWNFHTETLQNSFKATPRDLMTPGPGKWFPMFPWKSMFPAGTVIKWKYHKIWGPPKTSLTIFANFAAKRTAWIQTSEILIDRSTLLLLLNQGAHNQSGFLWSNSQTIDEEIRCKIGGPTKSSGLHRL